LSSSNILLCRAKAGRYCLGSAYIFFLAWGNWSRFIVRDNFSHSIARFQFCCSLPEVIQSEEHFLPNWRGHKKLDSLEVFTRIFLRSVSEALRFAGLVGVLEFLEAVKALTGVPYYFQLH